MNLLLDTSIVLWWAHDDGRLGEAVRQTIASAERVFLSSVVVWEVEIKRALGTLRTVPNLRERALGHGFAGLALALEHAEVAGRLPRHHGDPFDRALIAQAIVEGLTLVTSDQALAAYDVPLLRA